MYEKEEAKFKASLPFCPVKKYSNTQSNVES
jgi:hypothetical protein